MILRKVVYIILLFTIFTTQSQTRKSIEAYRFINPPVIDGKLNESEWKKITPAEGFTFIRPETKAGEKLPDDYKSKVYFGYDNNAIYVGAQLNHPDPENIPREFGPRDIGIFSKSEAFWISLDTYDDRSNYFSFFVTSAGTIADLFQSGDKGDVNYDTVFDAKIDFNESGWSLEMFIPYSAIRFPKKDVQNWGLNFVRRVLDFNGDFVWNPVDKRIFKYHESMGLLKNIKNIEPPTRLFFYPYLQSSVNARKGTSPSASYSAGLDLKYGLNSSFTFDMTLIPDFGQVSFDDRELNLSPFEQQFKERRAFFTEGADLFKKADVSRGSGNFFYSRRIGQSVQFNESDFLKDGDELIDYDEKPDLINSVKITGTTDQKLSIGFLNAITGKAYAYIKQSDNSVRREMISPLTNFNVISLSQQLLNDYSSISFLNSNVNRSTGPNGNNSSLIFDLYDNKRDFNFKSSFFNSYAPRFSENNGFRGSLNLDELRGSFTFGLGWYGVDRYYNQNELGIYNLTNAQRFNATIRYRMLKETKKIRTYTSYLFFNNSYRFHDFMKTNIGWRFGNNIETQNLTKFEADFYYNGTNKDFYEPRVEDRFLLEPSNYGAKLGFDTNFQNTFSYGMDYETTNFNNKQFSEKKYETTLRLRTRYRVTDKLSFKSTSEIESTNDEIGYLQKSNDNIYFGIRDVQSIENSIQVNYNIDNYKSLSLRLRNFWSSATYDELLFNLMDNGKREIVDYSILTSNPNTNFNLWNLDLKFDWWFSPGSTISLNYKNQIFNRDNESGLNYYKSLKNLFELSMEHQLSLRINYLIDYDKIRRKNRKKP